MEGKAIIVDAPMAKYWIAETALRVAYHCTQLYGGYGYCERYAIARAWGGTSELPGSSPGPTRS
jgi:acyl-CoA dehydrogenase